MQAFNILLRFRYDCDAITWAEPLCCKARPIVDIWISRNEIRSVKYYVIMSLSACVGWSRCIRLCKHTSLEWKSIISSVIVHTLHICIILCSFIEKPYLLIILKGVYNNFQLNYSALIITIVLAHLKRSQILWLWC